MFMEKQEKTTPKTNEEKVKKITSQSEEITDAKLVYEVSYILLPTLNTSEAEEQVAHIKKAIETTKGTMISDENPILIDLAYSMTKVVGVTRHKCLNGYFGWMKFEMPKGIVEGVKKSLDNNDTVLRYLIIKTVKENTLLTGKMTLKKDDKHHEDVAPVESENVGTLEDPAATPEEMDKSIDELVIA